MSSPGWYPDPAGDPNLERWWDGGQWTPSTRTPPPPAPGAPTGGPSWPELAPQQTQAWGQPPPPQRRTGLVVGLVALVLLLVAGGVVGALALTGSDGPGTVDPVTASPPTPSPTSEKILSACPVHDSRMRKGQGARARSGGLSFALPQGYSFIKPKLAYGFPFPWGVDQQMVNKPLVDTWVSLMVVGRLPTQGGYTTLKQSAESLIGCITRSRQWFHFDDYEAEVSEAREIDGHEAWLATMRVDLAEAPFEEDLLTVVVIDTGAEGEYGVFVADAPGDPEYEAEQKAVTGALESLRVD